MSPLWSGADIKAYLLPSNLSNSLRMFNLMNTQDLLVVIVALVSLWVLYRRNCNNAPFPTGPRGLPLVGN